MKVTDQYIKLVEWSEEDQCYVGSSPGLIGSCCHGKDEVSAAAPPPVANGPPVKSEGLTRGKWRQSQIAATALIGLRLDSGKLMPRADSAMAELLH